MKNERERVNGFASDEYVEFDKVALPISSEMIVERSVAARDRFQAIIKIQHYLVQRQFVSEHHTVRGDVFELFLYAALLFKQWENAAQVIVRRENRSH